MKISAVICEYNPFHLGHAYHISEIKKNSDAVIAVMSGSFTQRGIPAVISKYERARVAIAGGADLVLELPFPYCAASAEYFARAGVDIAERAGVDIAERAGVVSELSFGSESGDMDALMKIAGNMNSAAFESALAEASAEAKGTHYGRMYFSVYRSLFGDATELDGSNNILGIAYLRELLRRKSGIAPHTVRREGLAYNDTAGDGFISASAARSMIYSGKIPPLTKSGEDTLRDCMASGKIARADNLFLPFAAFLRMAKAEEICRFSEMNSELASRLISAARTSCDMASLIAAARTKSYSEARINRAMLFALLGITDADFGEVGYTSLLAANETGRRIVSEINKNGNLFILTKPADYRQSPFAVQYEKGLRAEALWTLALDKPAPADLLIKSKPYII